MICPNCGYAAKDNDRFCIKCGSLLRQPEPAPAEEPIPVEESSPIETVEEAVCEEIPAEAENAPDDFGIEPADPYADEPIEETVPVEEPVPEEEPVPAEEPVPEEEPIPVEEPVPEEDPVPVPEPELAEAPVFEPEPIVVPPVKEAPAETKSILDKPLSVWGYLWRIVLFAIPIFNIIPLFTMAFSSGINKNSKHFASAVLIIMIVGMLICIGLLIAALVISDPTSIRDALTRFVS